MIKHFLSLSSFALHDLDALLQRAQFFSLHQHQPDKINHLLKDKILFNAFYEPSTRTRCSFEIAAKRLGAQVVNFTPEGSSVMKGETIYDTLRCFESLGADGIILRHADDHVFDELASKIKTPMMNAGAGKYEHPSQGLLDLLTMQQEFGSLKDLTVAVCGDIKHSRVVGSLRVAARIFGMKLLFCGPEELIPPGEKTNFDEAIPRADVVMMLRIQLERHQNLELDPKSYHQQFGLHMDRVHKMKSNAIIMHPGPFNRGVEISDDVVECSRSRIFKQMGNGVFARMAILEWALKRGEQ